MEQLAANKRQAEIRKKHEEMDKLTEELEIAKLQEEKARALPISEKEKRNSSRTGSSRASTNFRSVSPISVQSDPFEKVPWWLDQINYDSKAMKKDSGLDRNASDSRPIQPKSDPFPHRTQMIHLAAKTAQPTIVNDGVSSSRFASKAASAKMQMNKTVQQHVQFVSFEPPNQQLFSNQTRSGTLPPPVAPSAN